MIAIKAENISKQYRLGQVGTGTLSHDLNRFWHQIRGKEDPYLKIGETNDRSAKGESEYVWSLRDINFEIEKGDAVGIIGRNGAGKSTLLKLLSRVTKPTTGKIYTKGRIASLLEVGTGFHPEMTGRENVFLNGAILGMTRKEIARKFDEIVDFSGVERYIDTPVKRYSSGMYVRLAFAVAAYLESEILIVDEVLAVGDADFQKKCLGKMGDVSKGEGKTVLFVSHNISAVKTLCNKGIVLESGNIVSNSNIEDAVNRYLLTDQNTTNKNIMDIVKVYSSKISIESITINGSSKDEIFLNYNQNAIFIRIEGYAYEPVNFDVESRFYNNNEVVLGYYCPAVYEGKAPKFEKGKFVLERTIELPQKMYSGTIFMSLNLYNPGMETFFELQSTITVHIEGQVMKNGNLYTQEGSGLLFLN